MVTIASLKLVAALIAFTIATAVGIVADWLFGFPNVAGLPVWGIVGAWFTCFETMVVAEWAVESGKQLSKWGDDLGRSVQMGVSPERWQRLAQRYGLTLKWLLPLPSAVFVTVGMWWRLGWWLVPVALFVGWVAWRYARSR